MSRRERLGEKSRVSATTNESTPNERTNNNDNNDNAERAKKVINQIRREESHTRPRQGRHTVGTRNIQDRLLLAQAEYSVQPNLSIASSQSGFVPQTISSPRKSSTLSGSKLDPEVCNSYCHCASTDYLAHGPRLESSAG